jgi:hypothetical protein
MQPPLRGVVPRYREMPPEPVSTWMSQLLEEARDDARVVVLVEDPDGRSDPDDLDLPLQLGEERSVWGIRMRP